LVRIPVYGHEKDGKIITFEELQDGVSMWDFCSKTDDYKKWKIKLDKVEYKRELYKHKCFLEHTKGNDNSDLAVRGIYESCRFLAKDKHKFDENQPDEIINIKTNITYRTYEIGRNHCHSHEDMTLREKLQNATSDDGIVDISKPPPKK